MWTYAVNCNHGYPYLLAENTFSWISMLNKVQQYEADSLNMIKRYSVYVLGRISNDSVDSD
jgi:hypothetical protein